MISILLIGGFALLVAISTAAVLAPVERQSAADARHWPFVRDFAGV